MSHTAGSKVTWRCLWTNLAQRGWSLQNSLWVDPRDLTERQQLLRMPPTEDPGHLGVRVDAYLGILCGVMRRRTASERSNTTFSPTLTQFNLTWRGEGYFLFLESRKKTQTHYDFNVKHFPNRRIWKHTEKEMCISPKDIASYSRSGGGITLLQNKDQIKCLALQCAVTKHVSVFMNNL